MAQGMFPRDSADFLLRGLSNNSIEYTNAPGATAGMDAAASALYQHADNYIKRNLINGLADSSTVLACHVLLTKLLEPGKDNFYHTTEDFTDSILVVYAYNGLSWTKLYDKINLSFSVHIDRAAITKIKLYWLSKKEPPLYDPAMNRQ